MLRPCGRLVVVVHRAPATRLGGLYRQGWRALGRVLPLAGAGPLEGARPRLLSAAFPIHGERRTGLGYWSQVVLGERSRGAMLIGRSTHRHTRHRRARRG